MSMIFTAENRHVADCGTPPEWLNLPRDKGETRSYFENRHGEQWIAFASKERLRIVCGDAGWDATINIESPNYKALAEDLNSGASGTIGSSRNFQNMVVGTAEAAWILAVLTSKA
jgi:hypothetical protein